MDQHEGFDVRRTDSDAPSSTAAPGVSYVEPIVDKFPVAPAEWKVFAELPAADRNAVYLRSIRKMLVFLTVLVIVGLVVTVLFALAGIHAIDQINVSLTVLTQ